MNIQFTSNIENNAINNNTNQSKCLNETESTTASVSTTS